MDQDYSGDHWKARNRSGEWSLGVLEALVFAGVIVLPAVTWKACNAAIQRNTDSLPIELERLALVSAAIGGGITVLVLYLWPLES